MKTTMKTLAALLGVSLLSLIPAKAVDVMNGDFQTTPPNYYGAIPNWNQDPNPSGYSGYNYLSGADSAWDNGYVPGTNRLTNKVAFIETYVGGGGSVPTLSLKQTVTGLTIGTVYELSYYENGRAHPLVNTTTAETFVGGVSVVAAHLVTPVNSLNEHTNPFHHRTAQFTATTESMVLEFRATQVGVNDTFLAIDNVAINAIPEPGSTTSHVSSSSHPQVFGSEVTFTATVTATGASDPTGSVTFKDGGSTLGSVALTGLGGGSAEATYSTSALALGSHTITAEYVSDSAEFTNSSSILTQFIYTPGPAFPVTFEYDTQLFSTGGVSGQGTPAWSGYFLSGYDVAGTVVSGQSYGGGSQALNVAGYQTSRVTLASPVQDQWFEFAFKPNFTNGTPATTWALTTRGAAGNAWGIKMGLSWDGSVGTVYVGDIGAGVTPNGTAIGNFTNGEWQTISFQTDNSIGNYKVYLGGNNTSLGTFAPEGFNGVQTLVFSSATQNWENTGNWYVDNINVGAQPVYVTGPTTVSYATWAATNAGDQAADLDWDSDGVSNGVEFFMNAAPGFTANPGLDGSNKVTWINGDNIPSTGYGTQFVVQISTDLVTWEDVGESGLEDNGGSLSYIVTGEGKQFVRLKVTP
jgi:hypothetical protein